MATLHVLIGIPGSGKTTYGKKLSKQYGYKMISSDEVRSLRLDLQEKDIFPEVFRLVALNLKNGDDVILDATNIDKEVRERIDLSLKQYNVDYDKIAYYFPIDEKTSISRVNQRNHDPNERFLPLDVPSKYINKIVPPSVEEGFKDIIIVRQTLLKGIKVNAIIFDLDGTLLDSTSVWSNVDKNFFAKRNMEVPYNYGKDISTMGLDEAAVYTKTTFSLKESVEEIKNEWLEAVMYKYVHEVELKKHVKEFIKFLKQNDINLSVATANSPECYIPCLMRHEILDEFAFIEDVKKFKNGKRSPELFNYVASLLKEKPSDIMVFEDTLEAIKVAKNAGFKVCAVFDEACSNKDEEEKKLFADIYIKDFNELFDL